MMVNPKKSPPSPVPFWLPPSKREVLISIRSTQQQARLAWITSKVERGPILGVARSSALVGDDIIDYLAYSDFVRDEGGLTVIPSFEDYTRLWLLAGMSNPFGFHFSHNSPIMHKSKWFLDYYDNVIKTLDEQIIIWGADACTEKSNLYRLIVTYIEALRLLRFVFN